MLGCQCWCLLRAKKPPEMFAGPLKEGNIAESFACGFKSAVLTCTLEEDTWPRTGWSFRPSSRDPVCRPEKVNCHCSSSGHSSESRPGACESDESENLIQTAQDLRLGWRFTTKQWQLRRHRNVHLLKLGETWALHSKPHTVLDVSDAFTI